MVFTFRSNRLGSAAARVWNLGRDLWALSLPVLIVLKLTGVIAWSWWWVLLSPLWVSGMVVTFRSNRPVSVGARIWNCGQDLWALSLPVLIVLKLTGLIGWSWWWVLSPTWISGILLAPVLCVLLVLLGWHLFRRAASSEELAAGLSQSGTRAARARPPVLVAGPPAAAAVAERYGDHGIGAVDRGY